MDQLKNNTSQNLETRDISAPQDGIPATVPPVCNRHCSVCEGMDHHWMPGVANEDENGDSIDGEMVMVCKHCDAVREYTDDDDDF